MWDKKTKDLQSNKGTEAQGGRGTEGKRKNEPLNKLNIERRMKNKADFC